MAYNEKTAERIRQALARTKKLVEKKMFGGIAFMINDKMCIGVDKDDLMIRCAPEMNDELLSKKGVRAFDLSGKPMKGWLLVSPDGTKSKKEFEWWIQLAIESNKKVTSSKKKSK
ncbi:MAG: TfoX/Sxy family protein [Bacteroidetes bacterium]|nr:TfoX/Sxy family protein [Bacteroidota bacterium]